MATFFDKFRKYAKDYTRERPGLEKGDYGQMSEVLASTLAIKGVMTKKSSRSSTIQDGHTSIGTWINSDVLYVGPEIDILSGDRVINGTERYQVEHIDWQDDFKMKNSHKIAYLTRIS